MVLETKIYTNKEIAAWFGVTYASFKNSKDKKLAQLKDYCDFKILPNGKIQILEIFDDNNKEYTKPSKVAQRCIEKNFLKYWDPKIDTCTRVAAKMKLDFPNELGHLKLESLENYVRVYREKYYGSPKKETFGELGGTEYAWAKVYGDILSADEEIKEILRLKRLAAQELKELTEREYSDFEAELREQLPGLNSSAFWALQVYYTEHDYEKTVKTLLEGIRLTKEQFKSIVGNLSRALGCDWIIKATKTRSFSEELVDDEEDEEMINFRK